MSAALDHVLSLVERVKRNGSGYMARCPAHEDRNPSLAISETDDGKVLVFCHAGCSTAAILTALGLSEADLFEARNGSGAAEIVGTYDYVDEAGELLFQVCRRSDKQFPQRRPDGAGDWIWNLRGVRRVLYRLPAVIEAVGVGERVWIAEGEKDVEALERSGVVATCNPGGAGKWLPEYAEVLRGADVVIVPDRDEAGHTHAPKVVASLEGIVSSVEIRLPAEGEDAADHLAAGHGLGDFELVTLDALAPEPDAAILPPFSITVYSARDLAALELPTPAEPIAGAWLRRAMATLVGGLTGHGKTTFIVHLLKRAADGGEYLGEEIAGGASALVLDLEQHLASIQRELHEAGLEESDAIDYAPIPEGLALDKRSDQLAAVEQLLAAKPYDVLVIDPFYKLHEADSSDELQARLLVALLRRWISEYGFALLTATHCRKLPAGRTAISLDDLFGSSLFTRDPELVLGIQRHGALTKLHVFKSREPGLEAGQVLELLFSRERGFWPRPIIDPKEREAELERVGETAAEWISEHPGESTNAVKKAVGRALKVGGDKVERALAAQVKSGLLPERVKGSRGALVWYPLNHAALTSPGSLLSEVGDGDPQGQSEDDFTRPSDFYVVEEGRVGEVVEARAEEAAQPSSEPASADETRDAKKPARTEAP